MSDDAPITDDRNPARVIDDAVAYALRLADTWMGWDGQPIAPRTASTPHTRRFAASPTTFWTTSPSSRRAWLGNHPCPTTGTPPPSRPRPTLPSSLARIWTRPAVG